MALPKFILSLSETLGLSRRTVFNFEFVQRMLRTIEARLKPLEDQKESLEQTQADLLKVGLDRINEVLAPAFQSILEIQSRGFLIARSATSRTLANNAILTFVIDDDVERETFTPSPFVALTREANADDYGIGRRIAYDQENGVLTVEVMVFEGAAGPHSDWVIGALAGSTVAQMSMLADGKTARDQAAASAGTATTQAGIATAAAVVSATKAGETQTFRNQAEGFAGAAAASALAAATFDPSSYYQKTETYTQAEVNSAIEAAVAALLEGAPGALDTLNELAAALGDDANFAATVSTALAGKQATSEKNQPNGYVGLDGDGKLPAVDGSALTNLPVPPSGWTEIATISPASGSAVTFTSIPEDYSELLIYGHGVSHDGDTNRQLRMEFSANNGASWSSPVVIMTGNWGASQATVFRTLIDGYAQKHSRVSSFMWQEISNLASNSAGEIDPFLRHDGGINALRFTWTALPNFDAGTITLYGR